MRYRNVWMDATVIEVTQIADDVRQVKIQPLKGTQAFGKQCLCFLP